MENKTFLNKIKLFVVGHKVWTGIIVLVLIYGGWQGYKKFTSTAGDTSYVTANVTKGTIISSVSATGQVAATNQIDLKARSSGSVTYVGVNPGDVVKKGKLLFSMDAKDAQKAVRSAETNLASAKLDLEKLKNPPKSVEVLAINQAVKDAETSKVDAQKAVDKAYQDLLNTSTAASADISGTSQTPPTITGTYTKGVEAVIVINVYQTGNGTYFNAYSTPLGVVTAAGLISTTLPQPIADSGLYIKFATSGNQPTWTITLPNKSVAAYQANYKIYQDALDNQKKTNDTADLTIAEKKQSLADLYQPDKFELESKELAVKQAEDNLQNAKDNLSDYYVYAPFGGTMASVIAKVGDVSPSTLGSIITTEQIANVSLNEVDVAKIKLGDKVNISFDAIPDLSLTGTVSQIDALGTVSQGVVSYNVKINFDTNDDQIKPGMSVSASIITNSKVDVLYVPAAAVKTNNSGSSYVQMFDTPLAAPLAGATGTVSKVAPKQVPVVTGISDDTNIEIVSGLKEGDQVVSRTIAPKSTTTAAPSLFGGAGGGGGGGSTRALAK